MIQIMRSAGFGRSLVPRRGGPAQAALGPNTARAASASAGCEAMVAVAGQRRDGPALSNWRRNSTVVTRRRRVRKIFSP